MEIRFHQNDEELAQLLELQAENHRNIISREEYLKEGFVTLKHSLEDLKAICGEYGHTVAVDGGRVVGYALTMLSKYHHQIPGLAEMVGKISQMESADQYLIMGQVCVAKDYRGTGLFCELYNHIRDKLISVYGGIYTEIDEENPRSQRAHEKIGFNTILHYQNSVGKGWNLVYWHWTD